MKRNEKPLIVLNTVGKDDISIVGGALSLPNGIRIRLQDLIDCEIIEPQEEVQQVVKAGSVSLAITARTRYKLKITIPGKRDQGWPRFSQEFVATSPADVTDQAAARTAIFNQLVERINDSQFPVTAAVVDNSVQITDKAGYWQKGREGHSIVRLLPEIDGSGWTNAALTTVAKACYAAGIGSDLTRKQPLVDPMIGNAYQGSLNQVDLQKIVGGQKYHTFIFTSVVNTGGNEFNDDQRMRQMYVQILLVDDGTGANTENAANFSEVLTVIETAKYAKYKNDTKSLVYLGKELLQTSGFDQGAPSATNGASNVVYGANTAFISTNIGAQVTAANASLKNIPNGVNLQGVATAGIGRELHLGVEGTDSACVVGKGTFSIRAELEVALAAASLVYVGFRSKVAVGAVSTYVNHAVVTNDGATLDISGRQAPDAAFALEEVANLANNAIVKLEVIVRADGTAEAFVNGQSFIVEAAAGVPLKFAAGTELVPFVRYTNVDSDPGQPKLRKLFAIADDESRLKQHIIMA